MAYRSDSTEQLLKHLSRSYARVRFGRGVVGKTSLGMVGLFAVWIMIVWRWSGNLWADRGLAAAGVCATGAFIWWVRSTQDFAEHNPDQALLDGAELIEPKRFEPQAKGVPTLGPAAITDGRVTSNNVNAAAGS